MDMFIDEMSKEAGLLARFAIQVDFENVSDGPDGMRIIDEQISFLFEDAKPAVHIFELCHG